MKILMSKSNNRESALTSTTMPVLIRYSMGVRYMALGFVLAFTNLPAIVFAQPSCPGIHVQIPNIENSTGTVACALFESPEGFPNEFLHSATNIMMMRIWMASSTLTSWGSPRKVMVFQVAQRLR